MKAETEIFKQFRERCKAAGINISALCEAAHVGRGVIETWRYKTPKTLEIYNSLTKELEGFEAKARQVPAGCNEVFEEKLP